MSQDDKYKHLNSRIDDDMEDGFSDDDQPSVTRGAFAQVAPNPFNRIEEEHLNTMRREPSAPPRSRTVPQRLPSPSGD